MDDISQRIKQLVDEFGKGNNSKFAEILGTSEANIRNYISGRQPKYDFLNALTSKLEISCEWLLAGKGDMLKKTDPPEENLRKEHLIRYYEVDASAGPIEMFDPGNGINYKDLIIPGFGDCDIALNVWGDSMEPVINKGEIILCKEWKESFIEYGYMYLVVTSENHRMIKYLQPGRDESTVSCESANTFYKPFEIKRDTILKLYIVKGHVERNAI
jgi:phage repressor protein C with HTH and peptisase S24 domain